MAGNEAEALIKSERPDLNVILLQPGDITTRDFRMDRVWIQLDETQKVSRPPKIG